MSEAKDTSPEVTLDQQDPLPESNWVFRRYFTGLMLVGLMAMRAFQLVKYPDDSTLWTDVLIITVFCNYMIAPSAEQAIKVIQLASLFRGGFGLKSSATVEKDGEKATATQKTEVLTAGEETDVKPKSVGDLSASDDPRVASPELPVPSRDAPWFSGPRPSLAAAREAFSDRYATGGIVAPIPDSSVGPPR